MLDPVKGWASTEMKSQRVSEMKSRLTYLLSDWASRAKGGEASHKDKDRGRDLFCFLANEPTEVISISTNVMFEMKINSSICRHRIGAVSLAFPYRVA